MTTIYKFPITAHREIFPVDSEEAKLNFGSSEKEKKCLTGDTETFLCI